MAKGRYLLDGEQVKGCRNAKGWTQEELAEYARLTPRTLQHVEANEGAFQRDTIERLAHALEVDPEQLIWCELVSWQQVPQMRNAQDETKLARAIRHDMEGQHAPAVASCREILASMRPTWAAEPETYAAVLIKLVTFLDHSGQHALALQEVNQFLQQVQHMGLAARDGAWARYHKALCLRRLGEFQEARHLLEDLRRNGEHGHVISSLHQLAVVDLEEAKQWIKTSSRHHPFVMKRLHHAHRLFAKCLTEWETLDRRLNTSEAVNNAQNPIGSTHRIGFTLRRLGEVLSLLGRTEDALRCYHRALVTFAWHHCQRYVTETYQEIEKLFDEDIRAAPVRSHRPFPASAY